MVDPAFITVFDIAEAGYRNWTLPAFGLTFIVLGTILLRLFNAGIFSGYQKRNIFNRSFPIFFIGLAVMCTGATFLVTFSDYWNAREALATKGVEYVEGVTQDFVPMVPHRNEESFNINGVAFHYSDYRVTAGFNQTESNGGPVHPGTYVRIWYSGNEILKLQVRKQSSQIHSISRK